MVGSNASTSRRRLDSWKEIASFFGRDERTVNRWEKELGLPVHRLPGTKGRVYAFADELSAWLATPRNDGVALPEQKPPSPSDPEMSNGRFTVIIGGNPPSDIASPADAPAPAEPFSMPRSSLPYGRSGWLLAAVVVMLIGLALVLFRHPSAGIDSDKDGRSNAGSNPQGTTRAVVQASSHAHNPEAEDLYLKGRYYWNKRTPDDLNKAVDLFTQAIVHDPGYARAYAGLADTYNLLREFSLMPSNQAFSRSLAAARRAVELDGGLADAHNSLAFASFYGAWDFASAEREFQRAIELDPKYATAYHWYANALLCLGRPDEALAQIARARQLDPNSAPILADRGFIL